uniref:Conserved secreted protein n=1 Tax=Panagrellus redivivus TaxID=6233 RepID=A0A7E4UWT4_PANRE
MRFWVCLSLIFLCFNGVNGQQERLNAGETISNSGKLLQDIMEMFAPAPQDRQSNDGPISRLSSMIPPFGLNRNLKSDPESVSDQRPSETFASSLSSMLMPPRRNAPSPRHPLAPSVDPDESSRPSQWSSLAKDVMGLFAPQSTTTTTTPAPVPRLPGMEMLNPKFYQQLIPDWMQPLNPFHRPEQQQTPPQQPQRPSMMAAIPFMPNLPNLLPKNTAPTQVDTGDQTFDRLVVREKEGTSEGPLGSLLGGKFNERGIQWTDGNLKLVNKKGNDLFGSPVAVHDRSIDIPVQRWFDIANNLVSAYSDPNTPLFDRL